MTGSASPGNSTAPGNAASGPTMQTALKDPSGAEVGTVTITSQGSFVKIAVHAQGLKPGFHGLHIHQQPKCEANSVAPSGGSAGAFLSAGGHWNVGDSNAHPHSGDLTSLEVRKDGGAELVTTTDSFTMDQLKADGGHAIIVHADADNFGNIPSRYSPPADEATMATGDAGARIACAVLK
jgi:Cu-Zn family superoxide dismutase